MVNKLYEYDNGREFGLASDEDVEAYKQALAEGRAFISRGYHGYSLKMTVRSVRTIQEEKKLFGIV